MPLLRKMALTEVLLMLIIFSIDVECSGRSLVFVFDTTGSMGDELTQVKTGGRRILQAALDNPQRDWTDFILVPFNDPEVGPATITNDQDVFAAAVDSIVVDGGGDCPENAIGGILKGLEVSKPYSYIFVFTDADAKDYHLTEQVTEAIQNKKSKVVFIMTGECGTKTDPGYTVYTTIASVSSGQVFKVKKGNVEAVLDAVIDTTIEGSDLDVYRNMTSVVGDANMLSLDKSMPTKPAGDIVILSIDSYVEDITISLSGASLRITVYDPEGNQPPSSQLSVSLDLPTVMMIKIKSPAPGNWTVNYKSTTAHTLRVGGKSSADFEPRFSVSHFGVHFNSTPSRPLAGVPVYAVIKGSGLEEGDELGSVDIVSYNGTILFTRPLKSLDDINKIYITNSSFGFPDGLFLLEVRGRDKAGYIFERTSHSAVSAVENTGYKECEKCSRDGTSQCIVIGVPGAASLSDAKFMCQCKTPYFSGDGQVCEDVDECSLGLHNCHEKATCINTIGGYSCDCNPGWTGNGKQCESVNECSLGTHNCHINASCIDTEGTFRCLCNTGYAGDGVNCIDIDECSDSTHSCDDKIEVCVNIEGSYNCVCATGYKMNGSKCVDVNECEEDVSPCHPIAGICTNFVGGYNCTCISGYTINGMNCTDIDECSLNKDICGTISEICVNIDGGYDCVCAEGFTPVYMECADIDECTANSSLCDSVTEVCKNTLGSYRCICAPGFYRNGDICLADLPADKKD